MSKMMLPLCALLTAQTVSASSNNNILEQLKDLGERREQKRVWKVDEEKRRLDEKERLGKKNKNASKLLQKWITEEWFLSAREPQQYQYQIEIRDTMSDLRDALNQKLERLKGLKGLKGLDQKNQSKAAAKEVEELEAQIEAETNTLDEFRKGYLQALGNTFSRAEQITKVDRLQSLLSGDRPIRTPLESFRREMKRSVLWWPDEVEDWFFDTAFPKECEEIKELYANFKPKVPSKEAETMSYCRTMLIREENLRVSEFSPWPPVKAVQDFDKLEGNDLRSALKELPSKWNMQVEEIPNDFTGWKLRQFFRNVLQPVKIDGVVPEGHADRVRENLKEMGLSTWTYSKAILIRKFLQEKKPLIFGGRVQ